MPDKWTGDLVGKMHNHRITYEELANKLGVTKAYVSMVLSGSRKPKNAETKFQEAVTSLIKNKDAS